MAAAMAIIFFVTTIVAFCIKMSFVTESFAAMPVVDESGCTISIIRVIIFMDGYI